MAVGVDLTTAPRASLLPRPLVPVPGLWSFWADTIVGAVPLGPVRASAFTCTSKLSDYGSGSVTLLLPSGVEPSRLLRLWSWRLWAMYARTPVWCGVPTGVQDTGLAAVTLTLTELPGYLTRRQLDWNPSKVYTQVEQTTIAADLAAPLADVGVVVTVSPGTGFKRDREYDYLSLSRAEALTNLAQVIQGPQFRAEYDLTAHGPTCTLRIAYPRVGLVNSGLGVALPGSALSYSGEWDADQLRTRTYAVGEAATDATGSGDAEPPKPVVTVDRPQSDLPRLDMVDDWPGVSLVSTLQEYANTAATQQAAPALKLTAGPSESMPDIRSYRVGDDVTVRVSSPLLPDGLTVTGQLTQLDIDAAAATAAWTISIAMPPPKARESLLGRLNRIDQTQRSMFRAAPMTVQALVEGTDDDDA